MKQKQEYKPTPSEPVTSTYAENYPAHPVQSPTRAPTKPAQQAPSLPFQGTTEAQSQFVAKEGERVKSVKRTEKAKKTTRFEGISEAHSAYPGHEAPALAGRVKPKYQPSNLPFEGRTEAQEAFVSQAAEPVKSYKPEAAFKSQ
jgi:hypothetical protein